MAKTTLRVGNSTSSVGFGVTCYFPMASTGVLYKTTESTTQITYHVAGTLSDIYANVRANTANGASTLRVRLNGGNGTQSVSITASTAGEYTDATPSNTDSVVDGDEVNYSLVVGGASGQMSFRVISCNFAATSNTGHYYATLGPISQNDNTTQYYPLADAPSNNTTEIRAQVEVNTGNMGFKNLYVLIASPNNVTGTSTVGFRDDGATTAIQVSIGSGASGIFEETATTITPAADSKLNFISSTASVAGTVTMTVEIIAISSISTDSTFLATGGSSAGSSTTSTNHFSFGGKGGGAVTYSLIEQDALIAANVSNVVINISANSDTGTSTFTLNKNTVATALQVSIATTATGFFEDPDTVAVIATDALGYTMTAGVAGTIANRSYAALVTNTEGGGATSVKDMLGSGIIAFAR
jgi:hypothetical protein